MKDIKSNYKKVEIRENLKQLKSLENGLSETDAQERLKEYGTNELKEKVKITPIKIFLKQFVNFIVWVLFAAAIISFFIGEIISFWVVLFIICFVILLGFIQEYKAEKSMEALKKIVQLKTKVLREGKIREIFSKYVVPGDLLLLETGDKISADAKIFQVTGLKVDESVLTGESEAVEKKEEDFIFAGTQIVYGKCKALVTETGMKTKIGKIAGLIQEAEELTPLQIKIMHLSKKLAIIALVACVLTFVLGLVKGAPLTDILIVSLALAVAAVPEGLPLTLTLTLAYGMRNMAQHNAIIRKMLGVETLGSVTVICTDKTGTLTKNEMTAKKIWADNKIFDISGIGYEPKGEFFRNNKKVDPKKEVSLSRLLNGAVLCNNSVLREEKGVFEIVGDPTEGALVVAGGKASLWKEDLEKEYKRIEEIIFTSERKLMTTIYQKSSEKNAFVKGAPEVVLEKCKFIQKGNNVEKLSKNQIELILKSNKDFAKNAYRVLGIAYKKASKDLTPKNVEKDLVFLGLIAMIDPPREEIKESILISNKAGIKTVMITGDNEDTAKAIAKEIGLFDENKKYDSIKNPKLRKIAEDGSINGMELNELNDDELLTIVEEISVYARIMPEQKLRIVEALRNKGHIVAMTGDGINDAPALKKADIGVAMGLKGTDVARESSVMVLQDDNFATIVGAVERGRTIYENIEKFTCYLISRNFTEVILILLGMIFLGFEYLPLLALHILFINTFDEIMPSIGLGLDRSRKEIMFKKPRNPQERILKKRNLILIISIASFMALVAFLVFYFNNPILNIEKARTLTFATIVGIILFIPFAFRSLEESIVKVGIFSNKLLLFGALITFVLTLIVMYVPYFQNIFEFANLSLKDWILPLFAAFSTLLFAEIIKKIFKNN